jgi:hypothetical protein
LSSINFNKAPKHGKKLKIKLIRPQNLVKIKLIRPQLKPQNLVNIKLIRPQFRKYQ